MIIDNTVVIESDKSKATPESTTSVGDNRHNGPFTFTTCAICGKEYIRNPGSIYSLRFAGRSVHCCSYTCYQKACKVKENVNESSYKKLLKEETL